MWSRTSVKLLTWKGGLNFFSCFRGNDLFSGFIFLMKQKKLI